MVSRSTRRDAELARTPSMAAVLAALAAETGWQVEPDDGRRNMAHRGRSVSPITRSGKSPRAQASELQSAMHNMLGTVQRDGDVATGSGSKLSSNDEPTPWNVQRAQAAIRVVKDEQLVYNVVFNELVRQVSTTCKEQGEVLRRVRKGYTRMFGRLLDIAQSDATVVAQPAAPLPPAADAEEIADLRSQLAQAEESLELLQTAHANVQSRVAGLESELEQARSQASTLLEEKTQRLRRKALRRDSAIRIQTSLRGYLARKELLARRNKQRRERALVTRALMQAQQDAHQANKQRHMERT